MFFELLSWDLFWVGMMISRTGWISVGASRLYFLRGEEKVIFVFFLGEIRLCNGDAWLGPGVYGEKCLVAVPFCDGAMPKSCKHQERYVVTMDLWGVVNQTICFE